MRGGFDKLRGFFREYTEGVKPGEIRRELRRDASQAYDVLSREHGGEAEPSSRPGRLWFRMRIVFLGLSAKLTPPRRVLFAGCVLLAVVGFVQGDADAQKGQILLLAAFVGIVFLLAIELSERILVRDELEVARQLQADLMPAEGPALAGWEAAHSYRIANTIGGDYYDFLPLEDGRLVLISADASGHGIAAGLLMAIANATLRVSLDGEPEPVSVCRMMNRALYGTGGPRAFMTAFIGVLEPGSGRLEYTCAGHPYPLVARPDGRTLELGRGALPLGIRGKVELEADVVTLAPGDTLVMYSDGIPESVDAAGRAFGFDRVRTEVSRGGSATAVHNRLLASLDEFTAGEPPADDRSLVVLRRLPEPPPPPPPPPA